MTGCSWENNGASTIGIKFLVRLKWCAQWLQPSQKRHCSTLLFRASFVLQKAKFQSSIDPVYCRPENEWFLPGASQRYGMAMGPLLTLGRKISKYSRYFFQFFVGHFLFLSKKKSFQTAPEHFLRGDQLKGEELRVISEIKPWQCINWLCFRRFYKKNWPWRVMVVHIVFAGVV